MKTNLKKPAIRATVLTVLFTSVLIGNNANAISDNNRSALQEIRDTATTICLMANNHEASRRDITVTAKVKFNVLLGKLINLKNVQVGGSYNDSTQKGILIDEITDDVIAAQMVGGSGCGLEVLRTLSGFLLIKQVQSQDLTPQQVS